MRLEDIGFYTLTDKRAATASETSQLSRCEIVLTDKCNFKCPYCRGIGEHISFSQACDTLKLWAKDGLKAVRFSGGEPLLWPWLVDLVKVSRKSGIERVAISTNGSLPFRKYYELWEAGVNDFSISLDACCAEDCDKMTGGIKGQWDRIIENIKALSKITYVTVGVVLTDDNAPKINEIIGFAKGLGVSDIRVIPTAQVSNRLEDINNEHREHPILKYRIHNLQQGDTVRGIRETDSHRCGLVLDDMAVCGDQHYPCIIYMRESGKPIGKVGPNMRQERKEWFLKHDTHNDPICSKNCLDVCRDYNNKFDALNGRIAQTVER